MINSSSLNLAILTNSTKSYLRRNYSRRIEQLQKTKRKSIVTGKNIFCDKMTNTKKKIQKSKKANNNNNICFSVKTLLLLYNHRKWWKYLRSPMMRIYKFSPNFISGPECSNGQSFGSAYRCSIEGMNTAISLQIMLRKAIKHWQSREHFCNSIWLNNLLNRFMYWTPKMFYLLKLWIK